MSPDAGALLSMAIARGKLSLKFAPSLEWTLSSVNLPLAIVNSPSPLRTAMSPNEPVAHLVEWQLLSVVSVELIKDYSPSVRSTKSLGAVVSPQYDMGDLKIGHRTGAQSPVYGISSVLQSKVACALGAGMHPDGAADVATVAIDE